MSTATLMSDVSASLLGGLAIGLAAVLLMAGNGRIAGVSGIVAGLMTDVRGRQAENAAFVGGLLLGLPVAWFFGVSSGLDITSNPLLLVPGGFLVGFGTRLGSGCTSGHGVCGLARLSTRSAAAVAMFLGTAVVTVFVMAMLT